MTGTPASGPSRVAERPCYWRATLYLHVASLVVSLVYITLTGIVSQPKYGVTTVGFLSWIGLSTPGLSLVVISGPELITRFLRASHRGWIPAVHIGLNLIAWLLACGMGSFFAYELDYMKGYDFGVWEPGCPDPDAYIFMCWGVPLFPHLIAIIVFCFILMIIHLTIFIMAIAQHKERQRMKRQVAKV